MSKIVETLEPDAAKSIEDARAFVKAEFFGSDGAPSPSLQHLARMIGVAESNLKAVRAAAFDEAANLSESIDNASNSERERGLPGCDAMGAVIEYRDKLRALAAAIAAGA